MSSADELGSDGLDDHVNLRACALVSASQAGLPLLSDDECKAPLNVCQAMLNKNV